jgi:hypothetical protein
LYSINLSTNALSIIFGTGGLVGKLAIEKKLLSSPHAEAFAYFIFSLYVNLIPSGKIPNI